MEQLCNLALWQQQRVKRDSANTGCLWSTSLRPHPTLSSGQTECTSTASGAATWQITLVQQLRTLQGNRLGCGLKSLHLLKMGQVLVRDTNYFYFYCTVWLSRAGLSGSILVCIQAQFIKGLVGLHCLQLRRWIGWKKLPHFPCVILKAFHLFSWLSKVCPHKTKLYVKRIKASQSPFCFFWL